MNMQCIVVFGARFDEDSGKNSKKSDISSEYELKIAL